MQAPRLNDAVIGVCLLLTVIVILSPCRDAGAAPFAYITNSAENTVSVLDTATNTVTATIPVGHSPQGVAVNPAGTRVYVANKGNNTVSVLDTATNTVTATIPVGNSPQGVAVNPAGTRVYVANKGNNSISILDMATNRVTGTVGVGFGPFGVAINPAGSRVYVANTTASSLSVLDTATNRVLATVSVGYSPQGVAINPAGTRVYVANRLNNLVSVVDTGTNSVTARVPIGFGPFGVAVNPAGTRVYVTSKGNNTVSVIDVATNTVTATIPVGNSPQGVAVNPAGTRVYVANTNQNTVSVIDAATNTVVESVNVGTNPVAFGSFIGSSVGPHPGETQLSGLSTNISGDVQAGDPITFTANAGGQDQAFYKFWYRAGYGNAAYDSNPWLVMQDFSTSNAATFSFPSADNYIVLVWAVADPNTIPDAVTLLGMNIKVNGGGRDVQFINLSANVSTIPQVGTPVKFIAEAIGPEPISYKFWYRPGYGTVTNDPNPWLVMQDFSTSNTATFSFPTADNYIVVVWAVKNPVSVDSNNVPIIGMNIKVE